MRTRRPSWDYNKPRTVRKPADVNICTICGNYVIDTPRGMKCMTCPNCEYVKVPEWLVDTVRCGLVMMQLEQAEFIARTTPDIGGGVELNWGQS
jgi:hypothetical protein